MLSAAEAGEPGRKPRRKFCTMDVISDEDF